MNVVSQVSIHFVMPISASTWSDTGPLGDTTQIGTNSPGAQEEFRKPILYNSTVLA